MLPGIASAVGGGKARAGKSAYLGTSVDTVNRSTYTFSAMNAGDPDATRYFVAAIGYSDVAGDSISSVTIGGQSCTIVSDVGPGVGDASGLALVITSSPVPTGTTVDVIVNTAGSVSNCIVSLYAIYDLVSTTPVDLDNSISTTDPSITINVTAESAVFALAMNGSAVSSVTWTGLTEDYDAINESRNFSTASVNVTATGTLAVTANFSTSSLDGMMIACFL